MRILFMFAFALAAFSANAEVREGEMIEEIEMIEDVKEERPEEEAVSRSICWMDLSVSPVTKVPVLGASFSYQYDLLGIHLGAGWLQGKDFYGFTEEAKLLFFPVPSKDSQVFFGAGASFIQYKRDNPTYLYRNSFPGTEEYKFAKIKPSFSLGVMERSSLGFFVSKEIHFEYSQRDTPKKEWKAGVDWSFKTKIGF